MSLMKYKKLKKVKDRKFKRLVGINREIFEFFTILLEEELKIKHRKGGRKPDLCVEDMLLMTMAYYRDYTTLEKLGFYYQLDASNILRWINWVELTIGSYIIEPFDIQKMNISEELLVDVTECTVQRPKDNEIQKEYYSGKKKKHTIKIQIIIEENSKKIVFVAFDKGHAHDFKIFKESMKDLNPLAKFLADSGYQGILDMFQNSLTPKKKSKNNPLSEKDKELNHLISSNRIPIEHVNRQLKIFRILSERYRNRRDTFHFRALFVCSIYNLDLIC